MISFPIALLLTCCQIDKDFAGITRRAVEEFIRMCETCAKKRILKTRPPSKPVIPAVFMQRVQVYIISLLILKTFQC